MSEPNNKPASGDAEPAGSHPVTGARLTVNDVGPVASAATPAPGVPPSGGSALHDGTRLRVVTVAPRASFPDVEAPSIDRRDPYVGTVIDGRYKVETVLGEGGMGVVYRCTHKIIGKKLALKVLRADLARDIEVTERFLNEAKSASAIGNAHIIDISDFGQFADGATYFVMEYLGGQPLSNILTPGEPIPTPRLLHISRQIAEGLSAAHAAGIVHRDLKPDNVFLVERGGDPDFVKILDFGIAKVSTSEGKLTRAGTVFGTPHYMSPEQAAGTSVDHRGDIYSIGVMMFEMAAGKIPFDADNFMGVLSQHMYKAAPMLSEVAPRPDELPAGLEAVVMKCLAKRPENRYQSMEELIVELDKLKSGLRPAAAIELLENPADFSTPGAYFDAEPGSALRVRGPAKSLLIGAALGVVILIGASAFLFTSRSMKRQRITAVPSQVEVASAPTAAQPVAKVGPALTQVALATEPLDAHIWKGSEDLGMAPVILDVPAGQALEVVIKREGYRDATVMIDGTEARQSIKLEKIETAPKVTRPAGQRPAKPAQPAPKATRPKSSMGGGEIIDPWK
jgi:tRNA A-37 threonylcarbamoyl transferase component Bud32